MFKHVLSAAFSAAVGIAVVVRAAPGGAQEPVDATPKRLTVAETLGSVYARGQHDVPFRLYRRADPRAKDALHKILEDPAQARFHGAVWRILGYIGDESDVRLSEKWLRALSGPLTSEQSDALSGMFDGLGLMCGRGVEAACTLVRRMQEPGFWEGVHFRWYPQPMPQRPPFAYESIMRLMSGYSLSRRPDLEGRVREILNGIGDQGLRNVMARSIDPGLLAEHAANMLRQESDPVTAEELKQAAALFNGDLDNPGPSELVSGFGGRQLPAKTPDEDVAKEALGAFFEIGDTLLREEFGSFMKHVIVDDSSDDQTKRGEAPELRGDVVHTRAFLQEALDTGPRPQKLRVERRREIVTKLSQKEVDVTAVSFELAGTELLGRRLRAMQGGASMVAEDGNLVVRMRHIDGPDIDGKWYWDPFGW